MRPLTNNLKKLASSLKNKRAREENGLFIVEGCTLCRELLHSSYVTEFIIVKSSPGEKIVELADEYGKRNVPVYIARSRQFEQLSSTETPQGIVAVARYTSELAPVNEPFVVLDGVSDPGNLGTIIRTADWFGFRHIFLSDKSVDKYNPKTVRSTMGSIFRCRILFQSDICGFIRENLGEAELYAATLNGSVALEECKPGKLFGVIMGNESRGVSDEMLKMVYREYKIPGIGSAESLNVAVAAGISMYHFSRFL